MSQANELRFSSTFESDAQNPPFVAPSVVAPSLDSNLAKTAKQSFIERFVDSFFHENNIRWMLVVGAAIVFASSLMLVTHEWSSWPVTVKYLAIVAYTSVIFIFSEIARRRLGLQTTANVLQVLTLLLLPIQFLSLQWLGSPTWMGLAVSAAQAAVLIIPTAGLTWYISQRIFEHLLRGHQRTFHACYFLLCVAGAVPAIHAASSISPWNTSLIAAAVSCALWLVMSVGVMKVNRHIFWMNEERRAPRIFGFFPIALLGGQFLILVAIKTVPSIDVEWLGFGCVMVSATILAIGRTVAQVFKERTGDLVRPLPWAIVVPIFIGLATMALGIGISFIGFSYSGTTTFAAVPTAVLAAVLLMSAANETRHQGLVWCGLVLVAVAYQCAPTLAADLVAILKSNAASAVQEAKLPIAFYGLTYLPLLSVLAISSRLLANRRRLEFSQPMQAFVTIMSIALLGLSLTHLKAAFPVATLSAITFSMMAVLFRDRRYIIGGIVALLLSTVALVPFANAMSLYDLPIHHVITALAVLAGVTSVAGLLDRWILSIPLAPTTFSLGLLNSQGEARKPLLTFGTYLTHGLTLLWIGNATLNIISEGRFWNLNLAGVVLLASLIIHTLRTKSYLSGLSFWILAAIAGLIEFIGQGVHAFHIASIVSILASVVAVTTCIVLQALKSEHISRVLFAHRVNRSSGGQTPILAAIVGPLCDLSIVATLCLATTFHLPMLLLSNISLEELAAPMATSLTLAACVAIAFRLRSRSMVVASVAMIPLGLSALFCTVFPNTITYSALPLLWTLPLCCMMFAGEWASTRSATNSRLRELGLAVSIPSSSLILAIVAGCCLYLHLLTLLAIVIGVAALLSIHRQHLTASLFSLLVLLNLQCFFLAEVLLGNRGWIFMLPLSNWIASLPYMLPLIALSVVAFDQLWQKVADKAIREWTITLRSLFAIGTVACILWVNANPIEMALVVISIFTITFAEFREAVRRQAIAHLWTGLGAAGLTLVFLISQDVLVIGAGMSQVVLVLAALLAICTSYRIASHPHFGFTAATMQQIGLTAPACVVLFALFSWPSHRGTEFMAFNTLSLLAAAGIYFYHGIATKQRRFVVAAVAIFNVTLAIVWSSMQWFDMQLYLVPLGVSLIALVELLRREIPTSAHDPLRYAGALTILVSPMLEILGGSWLHLLTLLILCVLVIFMAIGLRLRALVYTGTAFLLVDLIAMVIHSSYDHPQLLWIAGLGVGIGVIAVAAICENQRERVLDRIRLITAELATWN